MNRTVAGPIRWLARQLCACPLCAGDDLELEVLVSCQTCGATETTRPRIRLDDMEAKP